MNINILSAKPFDLDAAAIEWVGNTFNALSPREKIGQIFIPYCADFSTENLKRLLSYQPGGIFRITGSSAILRESARFLQEHSAIPLLMCADLELSAANSISDGTVFPNQLGAAATGDPGMAGRMGRIAAREGGYCGFNWSLTPEVDVDMNFRSPVVNTRSFGSNPDTVLHCALEYVRAMQNEDMAACLKHWPGDGVDDRDQHFVTSCNSLDMPTWRQTFGKVYRALVDAGVKSVMSAHITLPAYYREILPCDAVGDILPACISKLLNFNLLRKELGFNGLIVSDATSMAGLTSVGPPDVIVPLVIENGCDMFLFSQTPDFDLALLLRGLETGRLSQSRLDEAVLRTLALKASLGLHTQHRQGNRTADEVERRRVLRTPEHVQWAAECAQQSITLVKDTQCLLPLSPQRHNRILLIQSERKPPLAPFIMQELLEDEGFDVTLYQDDTFLDPDLYHVVMYIVEQEEVMFKRDLRIDWEALHHGQMKSMLRFWHLIPTLFISLGNPYHLYDIPRCKTYINAYSPIEPVQQALVKTLIGRLPFRGIHPVDPFCGLEH